MAEKIQPGKIDGALSAGGFRFGIVVSRFNSFITERLQAAAVDTLERAGAASKDVDVVHVPGAFELPLAAKKLAATGKYDALIAIGCVLRGETTHYDYVCSETARGLQLAQMDSGLPIMFCVLTCDTLEQAIDRAGLKGAQGRKQGVRSGPGRHRNGATVSKASLRSFESGTSRKAAAEVTCLSAQNPASLRCRCYSSGT